MILDLYFLLPDKGILQFDRLKWIKTTKVGKYRKWIF